jgi:dTDP-4-dehydrorhamnose 3,5-epimerase
MRIESLALDGPLLIHLDRHGDARGWFSETWSESRLAQAGFKHRFVQDNLSFSAHQGTLRGLHCQTPPFAQGKLVSVVTGAILDVAVDVRDGSPSYGQWAAVRLDADTPSQFWIPEGFLHGFLTLAPETRVTYKTTAPYSRDHDRAVAWNDPAIAVDWGVDAPILSDKDRAAPLLQDAGVLFPQDAAL